MTITMDPLKKAFTTPVMREGASDEVDLQRQVSPDAAPANAPPAASTEKLSNPDAAIAAIQGFTFDPKNLGTSSAGQSSITSR